ncbi:methyltransferase [Sanghuangporus baumii]|uniref:Methyltransferase n=1 Tax=Sanghuangporus baumii TaxID=108892 RepID=A0A9Q5NAB8_SANBA|nr:methyltransferase [Sanghuangporus baumii]
MPSPAVQVEASSSVSLNLEPRKTASSVHDVLAEKPPFGSRFLTDDADVWSKNAWDHVPPPDDQHERIASSLARQRAKPVPEEEKTKYNEKPAKHWDNFYKMNADKFFRNRKWLHTEFPELVAATHPNAGPVTIAEIGCGAGNSVFPLLAANQNPDLHLYAFDYSSHAVKLVQHNEHYLSPSAGSIRSSVWDLTSTAGLPEGIAPSSIDIVVLIFVLSALHPNEWARAVSNIYKMLRPGGLVVLRDYGRHDLTQLRFKEGRLLEDNFYIRGDKTRVYFFELDDLAVMFTGSPAQTEYKMIPTPKIVYEDEENSHINGKAVEDAPLHTPGAQRSQLSTPPSVEGADMVLTESTLPNRTDGRTCPLFSSSGESESSTSIHLSLPSINTSPHPASRNSPLDCPPHPLFSIEQLGIDRRLLINRRRQLKMYRVWMQGKFRKLPLSVSDTEILIPREV